MRKWRLKPRGGVYRTSERNLGVAHYRIEPELESELQQIVDDARYWTDHKTYAPDELAVRFHHRLVTVHPFPNGNGRLVASRRRPPDRAAKRNRFTWGGGNIQADSNARRAYIEALHAADNHDMEPLIRFERS
jgi:Fic-DOC domain mobile mystery protein B